MLIISLLSFVSSAFANYVIRHSIDGVDWSKRADLSITRDGAQLRNDVTSSALLMKTATNSTVYYVSLGSVASTGQECDYTLAMSACPLLESGFSDVLAIDVGADLSVLGFALHTTPLTSANEHTCLKASKKGSQPRAMIRDTVVMAGPNAKDFLEKLTQDMKKRKAQESQDNRSFFQKYWMYIVIGIVVLVVMNASPDEGGG